MTRLKLELVVLSGPFFTSGMTVMWRLHNHAGGLSVGQSTVRHRVRRNVCRRVRQTVSRTLQWDVPWRVRDIT